MNFFRERKQIWMIEKATPGKYRNSPPVWSRCGPIRETDRARATLKAMFQVGSSRVRVIPMEESR